MMIFRLRGLPLFTLITAVASGCATVPKPLTEEELLEAEQIQKTELFADQEPVTDPVSLHEAIARALKYNRQLKVEVAEQLNAMRRLDVEKYSQWPELAASIRHESRNNFSGGSSRSLIDGEQSLESSTSTERNVNTGDLVLSWNILDFGLSYIRSKQAANRVLIAREEERQIINNVVKEVWAAYWQALSAQRLLPVLNALLVDVHDEIEKAEQTHEEGLESPLDSMLYRRDILSVEKEIKRLIKNLVLAKYALDALINAKPGSNIRLIDTGLKTPSPNRLDLTVVEMESLILRESPELQILAYEDRITAAEGKAALLELLPGLQFFAGAHTSDNSFLFNQNWLNIGGGVSWNLIKIFQYGGVKRLVESEQDIIKARRLATVMVLLTRLQVSLVQYAQTGKELSVTKKYTRLQEHIAHQYTTMYHNGKISARLSLRERLNLLLAELELAVISAQRWEAYATLIETLGINFLPKNINDISVNGLSDVLKGHWDCIVAGQLRPLVSKADAPELSCTPIQQDQAALSEQYVDKPVSKPVPDTQRADEDAGPSPPLAEPTKIDGPRSWYLQVGTFNVDSNAESAVTRLNRLGISSVIRQIQGYNVVYTTDCKDLAGLLSLQDKVDTELNLDSLAIWSQQTCQ